MDVRTLIAGNLGNSNTCGNPRGYIPSITNTTTPNQAYPLNVSICKEEGLCGRKVSAGIGQ